MTVECSAQTIDRSLRDPSQDFTLRAKVTLISPLFRLYQGIDTSLARKDIQVTCQVFPERGNT